MTSQPSIAIIGAGVSGLTMAKALKDRGLSWTTYEKSDAIGGNWVFRNKNGMSSAYRSLHIDSSRFSIAFDDYPMPPSFPDFPHHTQIREYFEGYADHFGLRERVRFNTGVAKAERLGDGVWRLTLDNGEVRHHDLLIVANGHHWDPRYPEPPFPGSFNGPMIHSHHYIDAFDPVPMHGKKILVVGIGNSAMDIACELSHRGVAEKLTLSTRRGAYVIPKYLFGRPLDKLIQSKPWLPMWPQRLFGAMLVRLAVGRMESYGLPKPAFKIWQAHPTVSSEFLIRCGSGDITVRPNVAELLGDRVRFTDGSVEPIDAIILATGYKISFPFFGPEVIDAPDNNVPLFKRAFKPGTPNLIFVGLAQAVPSIIKFVEVQTRWLAAYVAGEYALPDPAEMTRAIDKDDAMFLRHFVATKRHTIQTDTKLYEWNLAKEWRRGRARARRQGNAFPIPALAAKHSDVTLQPA